MGIRAELGCGAWARLPFSALLLLGALLIAMAEPARAQSDGCTEGELLTYDPSYPVQLILTCVPPNWNGTLVVYAHGYEDPQEPLAVPDVTFGELDVPTELMKLGFAFATSSFRKNGYAVQQAGNDLNALVAHFPDTYGTPPDKVLIIGASEGALIATMLVERYPQTYAGGLALCGPLGGANAEIQYLGDFRAVFDVYFDWIFDFGIVDGMPTYSNYGEYLAAKTYYAGQIGGAFSADQQAVEQLFSVTKVPRNPDPNINPIEAATQTALSLLRYNVFGFNDLRDVAGGNPYGNRWRWYSGSDNDWWLNRKVERVSADPAARQYLREYYAPTGRLQRPLVSMHTTTDEIVPFWHELIYGFKVIAQGNAQKFTLLPVPRYGHCNFTEQEVLGSLALLLSETGTPLSPVLESYRRSLETTLAPQ
jgi:pimeloyl-ACP methyl ester carboxylesterase